MRYKLLILTILCTMAAWSQTLSDHARVVLLSCEPGNEAYARYGHSAIRVTDPENNIDWVFNYGLFDFYAEDFYVKFVKGETYYILGAQRTNSFYREYAADHRKVYEQVLNLNRDQCQQVWDYLLWNLQEENREYLYNFVFDNCATRPYYLIEKALGESLVSDYKGLEGTTFRDAIRSYTDGKSWVSAGINLVFGPKADQPMSNAERLFLPEELMNYVSGVEMSDGKRLVAAEHIAPFKRYRTPWYAAWWLHTALLVLLLFALSMFDLRRGKISWWADCIIGIVYILLLAIVTFLTFFSIHPLVGFGWRLLIIPALWAIGRIPVLKMWTKK